MYLVDVCADAESGEWVALHGRSVALAVGLREAGEKLSGAPWSEQVSQVVLVHCSTDRVHVASSGLRAAGYLVIQQLKQQQVDMALVSTLAKVSDEKIKFADIRFHVRPFS